MLLAILAVRTLCSSKKSNPGSREAIRQAEDLAAPIAPATPNREKARIMVPRVTRPVKGCCDAHTSHDESGYLKCNTKPTKSNTMHKMCQ